MAGRDWRAIVPEARVTISAGIAGFCKGETVEQLLHRADQALYQAKNTGRNRTVVEAHMSNIRTETKDRVLRIEIARTDKKNALTQDMYRAMSQALAAADVRRRRCARS